MRKTYFLGLFLIVAMVLAGCNLPTAGGGQPTAASPTQVTFPTATTPPTAPPAPPTAPPPIPTAIPSSPTPLPPTATPTRLPKPEIPIRFAPGAIHWQAPLEPRAPGYVFWAMQGQSAEILVLQGDQPASAALSLAAPDGQPLQTYNIGRPDWRGVLPQTGDYHLAIAAPGGLNGLTLQVTIYPLPTQPHSVTNANLGFTLTYDGAYFQPQKPDLFGNEVLGLRLTPNRFYDHTNLQDAYFVLSLESYTDADTCLNAPPEDMAIQNAVGTWRVNGIDYRYYIGGEGAAGNFYDADIFRTFVHNRCITVYLFVHSTDIGNYTPGTVTAYDKQGVADQLKRVFFTLQWP